jgi:hypothetical protein
VAGQAIVYNSFPLNNCPSELWDKLDADSIAKGNDAVAALLNGPRYCLTTWPNSYSLETERT